MNGSPRRMVWQFMGRWTIATVTGFVVGMLGAIIVSYLVVNLFYPKETNLIVGLCVGAAVGAGQIIAGRPWFRLTKAWIWGAMVIMGPPFVASVICRELGLAPDTTPARAYIVAVAVAGGLAGSWMQARVLREHSPHWGWWIVASPLSWGIAYATSDVAGTLGSALALGAVSAGLVLWLLRDSIPGEPGTP